MKHVADLSAVAWPISRLGELIESTARRSDLLDASHLPSAPSPNLSRPDEERIGRWIESTAPWLGCEAARAPVTYAEVDDMLLNGGPAILMIPGAEEPRFIALLESRSGRPIVMGPDHRVYAVERETLRSALCRGIENPLIERYDRVIADAGIPRGKRDSVRAALFRAQLGGAPIRGCWQLRQPPSAGFLGQLRRAKLPHRLLTLISAHIAQYSLFILSWWVIGVGALEGTLEYGWMIAWALLLITMVPFRLLATWTQGVLAIGTSGLLKMRLLHGALCLEPDEIRHEGAGHLLSRVLESEAIESLALSSGFLAIAALIELALTGWVLSMGASGPIMVGVLIGWTVVAAALGWRYYRRLRDWTHARLDMTQDLVERMSGHRTRLVQEKAEQWHDEEDRAVDQYLHVSQAADDASVRLTALIPRGWMFIGLLGLAPAFVEGAATVAGLAVGIGGVLLGAQAFAKLSGSITNLAGAIIAWSNVRTMFHASGRHHMERSLVPAAAEASERNRESEDESADVLRGDGLTYRYHGRGSTVLENCCFVVRDGDRILLEGPSGSGKSTLAAIVTGLREQRSGLLLLEGMDRHTIGREGWRERIATAPQFHENHVLTGRFAFNLLMGRRWPATQDDLREAEQVCRGLGLGELLDRMPAGLQQTIGETGWQLSHGEKSRLYIARAILQRSRVVVLDESFAALDPATLRQCLECVLNRAQTLLVIAHP